jgi:hypothetical protein
MVPVGVYAGATVAPFAFGTLPSSFGFASAHSGSLGVLDWVNLVAG